MGALLGRAKETLATLRQKIGGGADWTSTHSVGVGTYGDPEILTYGSKHSLRVGNYCSFADGVQIFLGGNHRSDWVTTFPFNILWPEARLHEGHPASKGDVVIGNDVWIARNAMVLSGVNVGDGAVIGAGSVVAREVEPYSIVAGNPARHLRFRFPETQRQALLEIRWWDWPRERIVEALPLLLSDDIQTFIDMAKREHRTTEA